MGLHILFFWIPIFVIQSSGNSNVPILSNMGGIIDSGKDITVPPTICAQKQNKSS